MLCYAMPLTLCDTVGLERILECLEKVQTSKGQDEVDDCRSTVCTTLSFSSCLRLPID
jgi:hypothetical protein